MAMLRTATYLLFLNGFLLLAYGKNAPVYLAFSVLSFILAFGVMKEVKFAIKVALVYSGVNFFFALLFLMAGNLSSSIDAAISLLIVHDILGYIQKKYGEEVKLSA
ncbi:hypothetical protein [Pyrococcus abyssi]|nr:hypothetical protein [Pyrococcus abyssi]